MITNIFTDEYKKQATEYIGLLHQLVRKSESTVAERINRVSDVTEAYFAHTDTHMGCVELESLANLILYDDYADTDRMKAKKVEYPHHSGDQHRRRTELDSSDKWAQDIATDGKDYRLQTRDTNRRRNEYLGL